MEKQYIDGFIVIKRVKPDGTVKVARYDQSKYYNNYRLKHPDVKCEHCGLSVIHNYLAKHQATQKCKNKASRLNQLNLI